MTRAKATRAADQRAHVRVPRLVRRYRDDELVVLPAELDVDALVAVLDVSGRYGLDAACAFSATIGTP